LGVDATMKTLVSNVIKFISVAILGGSFCMFCSL